MARTNKYTSLNFNDIYDKKITTTTTNSHRSSSSSPSVSSTNKTLLSNSRIHGNMLVLTRPSPKPIAPPQQPPPPPPPTAAQRPDLASIESDSISLRPLGRTGSASSSPFPLTNLTVPVSPKTNKFVPPHLRPGFHGREEKPEPEIQKQPGFVPRSSFRQSPLVYQVEEGRPKSGGGYERGRGGFEANSLVMNRPRSSGSNRPFSSG